MGYKLAYICPQNPGFGCELGHFCGYLSGMPLPREKILAARRLLKEGQLSQREIARRVRISRMSVMKIARCLSGEQHEPTQDASDESSD